ncbi:hypothetical protein CR513_31898, partial [Mucuna pruriens]
MNVFDTVMNINVRTKDTHKTQMDIVEICNRKELELKDIGCTKVAIWVCFNLGRCIDVNQGNLHGMKSHDCHLLPIAFDSLAKHIWNPLIKVSHFFRELTLTTLIVEKLTIME